MIQNRLSQFVAGLLARIFEQTRTWPENGRIQANLAIEATPAAGAECYLRPSKVLPGQLIMPLAWPVNEPENDPLRLS